MCLGESAFHEEASLDLAGLQRIVSFDENVAHFHLFLLVDVDIQDDAILACDVVALHDFNLGVLESLVVEVFLGQYLGPVHHVGRDLRADQEAEFLLHVLAFGLLEAVVVDGRHARAAFQVNVQINLPADDGVGSDGHFREEPVFPVASHRVGDLPSRDGDLAPDGQSRDSRQLAVLVALDAVDVEACNDARTWGSGVGDVGMYDLILCFCSQCARLREGEGKQHFLVYTHILYKSFLI